jgi:aspartate oxidase
VLVLAKGELVGGSTSWAQGGIAAVLEPGDTFESHIEDTMIAGAGLNRSRHRRIRRSKPPAAIERLAALGVPVQYRRRRSAGTSPARAGIRTAALSMSTTRPAGRCSRRC